METTAGDLFLGTVLEELKKSTIKFVGTVVTAKFIGCSVMHLWRLSHIAGPWTATSLRRMCQRIYATRRVRKDGNLAHWGQLYACCFYVILVRMRMRVSKK